MSHDHHGHEHHHHHGPVELTQLNRAFIIGIALNFLFVVIEVGVGLFQGSLSLLSDAGHNLGDVASLAIALLAYKLAQVKPNDRYTYGYRKTTILVALLNSVILLVSIGIIAYEAIRRLSHPEPVEGKTIAMVALIGIFINAFTAYLFMQDKEKDINARSAYLHLASDALVSLGIVIGGVIIYFTGWFWLDAVIGVAIAVVILMGTWSLLRDSLRLSLDGVPEGIDLEDVQGHLLKVTGVKGVHHVHVWALSTTVNALTAHVVVGSESSLQTMEEIKHKIRHQLEHLNIKHSSIEMEGENVVCKVESC